MEKSKLPALLATFDGYEWRAFLTFLRSPYFNRREEIIQLARVLRQALGNPPLPEREVLFRAVYPDQQYDEKGFNHSLSALQVLAERFLALRRFEAEGVWPDYLLLREYVDRQLDKSYDHAFRRAQRRLERIPERDGAYLLQRYFLAQAAEEQFTRQQVRRYDPALQEAADALDDYYLSGKLKYLCGMLDRQKVVAASYELHLIDEVKAHLSGRDLRQKPAIHLYFLLLLVQTEEPADPHFQRFRDQLRSLRAHFSTSEMRDLYYFAINFCIQRLRYGEKTYTGQLMELYREGLEYGYLLDGGQLSPWTFKNMVKLGLGLQQFDWVEQFILQYADRLPAGQSEDAYHFNLAELSYHLQDYDRAMDHLNQVEFSDVHYSLGAKVMLLKIYYETDAEEALLSLLFSFRLYLRRNRRIPREVKMPYQNFIRILQQLQRHRPDPPPDLRETIQNTTLLTERSWLHRCWRGEVSK